MQLSFSAQDIDELFAEWSQQTGTALRSNDFETILDLPPRIGQGRIHQIKLRPGLELTLKNIAPPEPLVLKLQNDFNWSMLEFTSSLSGHIRGTTYQNQREYYIAPQQSYLGFMPNYGGTIECQPHHQVIHVEISIEPQTLMTLINGHLDQVPPSLRSIVEGTSEHPYYQPGNLTRAMRFASEQILSCPYHGLTKRLYLESRAIELIALHLHNALSDITLPNTRPPLRRDEIERIHHAKEILLNNLENPPSLLKLAQQVGLNDYKLKRGFRQVFGTTTFGYLHHYRMEQARSLLAAGLNVTQVAQAVGYNSTTSFSAAFRKKFGLPPKVYKSHNRPPA
jgi:AraC-like DNA-binding protein